MAETIPPDVSGGDDSTGTTTIDDGGFVTNIYNEIINSPLNMLLIALIFFLVYKIIKSRSQDAHTPSPPQPSLPKLRKDFTVQELRAFDGSQPDGRVLVAINGFVYDCTKGKHFYGPGGPYAAFGGRDASRGLATFQVKSSDQEEYDDLSDLNAAEMDSMREWETQFKERYELVGKLLKPGEEPSSYSDDEDDAQNDSSKKAAPSTTNADTPPTTADSAAAKSKDD